MDRVATRARVSRIRPELDKMADEIAETVRVGTDYADLVSRPGWKRLLDDLEAEISRRLGTLRECQSSDPVVIKAFRDRWAALDDAVTFIEKRVEQALTDRMSVMTEIASADRVDPTAPLNHMTGLPGAGLGLDLDGPEGEMEDFVDRMGQMDGLNYRQ